MLGVERKLRDLRAAFHVTPGFANWVRTRSRELEKQGRPYEIILVWGRRRFHIGSLPEGDPYFAIELSDGSLERSPWVEPER
jgi:hypothetical protein